jgi:hypothetical protein
LAENLQIPTILVSKFMKFFSGLGAVISSRQKGRRDPIHIFLFAQNGKRSVRTCQKTLGASITKIGILMLLCFPQAFAFPVRPKQTPQIRAHSADKIEDPFSLFKVDNIK